MCARTLTPALQLDERPTSLWLIDLGAGKNRLGGSALAQVYGGLGDAPADLDDAAAARCSLAAALAELRAADILRAYHDRLRRRAIRDPRGNGVRRALRTGHRLAGRPRSCRSRSCLPKSPVWSCSSWRAMSRAFTEILARHGLATSALYLGAPTSDLSVQMRIGDTHFNESWRDLRQAWSETSWRMRRLRDDPAVPTRSSPRRR